MCGTLDLVIQFWKSISFLGIPWQSSGRETKVSHAPLWPPTKKRFYFIHIQRCSMHIILTYGKDLWYSLWGENCRKYVWSPSLTPNGLGSPDSVVVKNPPANAGDTWDMGSIPGPGRFLWSRKWQPTPVFLPGKPHGQRNLVYSHGITNSWTWLSIHMCHKGQLSNSGSPYVCYL